MFISRSPRTPTPRSEPSTPPRSPRATRTTAPPASAPSTTRATTPRSCSTRTATTSRSSTTTAESEWVRQLRRARCPQPVDDDFDKSRPAPGAGASQLLGRSARAAHDRGDVLPGEVASKLAGPLSSLDQLVDEVRHADGDRHLGDHVGAAGGDVAQAAVLRLGVRRGADEL